MAQRYGNSVVLGVDAHGPEYLLNTAAWQRGTDEVHALGLPLLETVQLR